MIRIFLLLLFFPSLIFSQENTTPQVDTIDPNRVLRVGLIQQAPFSDRDDDGNWTGMSLEFWRQVAERENVRYELVPLGDTDDPLDAVASGKVDVFLSGSVSAEDEERVNFLYPYHETTLGVAKPERGGVLKVLRSLFTWEFAKIILYLSALLLVIAIIIYFLERKDNEDDFGGDGVWYKGIGASFWWSMVTMTTIGYGDKAPKTVPGRIVAMLWMLLALAVTSSLTAAIISASNSSTAVSIPDDLRSSSIGVRQESPAAEYLRERNVTFETFPGELEGLRALADDQLDYFMGTTTPLEYQIKANNLSASVQPTTANPQAIALVVPNDSRIGERLNQASIAFALTKTWQDIVAGYTE